MKSAIKTFVLLTLAIISYDAVHSQTLKKIVLDEKDIYSGHYLVVEPEDSISGVLVLLAGFGQVPEDSPSETKLHNVAYRNNILTIFYAAGNKLYADSSTQAKLTIVMKDIIAKYKVKSNSFVLGGYSAGGMIALRYVELCNEFPTKFPIQPKAVFTVDSPIDIDVNARHNSSESPGIKPPRNRKLTVINSIGQFGAGPAGMYIAGLNT